jgi:hypothetical protein
MAQSAEGAHSTAQQPVASCRRCCRLGEARLLSAPEEAWARARREVGETRRKQSDPEQRPQARGDCRQRRAWMHRTAFGVFGGPLQPWEQRRRKALGSDGVFAARRMGPATNRRQRSNAFTSRPGRLAYFRKIWRGPWRVLPEGRDTSSKRQRAVDGRGARRSNELQLQQLQRGP